MKGNNGPHVKHMDQRTKNNRTNTDGRGKIPKRESKGEEKIQRKEMKTQTKKRKTIP
jgi:hypothetical protein